MLGLGFDTANRWLIIDYKYEYETPHCVYITNVSVQYSVAYQCYAHSENGQFNLTDTHCVDTIKEEENTSVNQSNSCEINHNRKRDNIKTKRNQKAHTHIHTWYMLQMAETIGFDVYCIVCLYGWEDKNRVEKSIQLDCFVVFFHAIATLMIWFRVNRMSKYQSISSFFFCCLRWCVLCDSFYTSESGKWNWVSVWIYQKKSWLND